MLKLQLPKNSRGPFRVLALGAHSDDIEIGCGGTVLRLCEENPRILFKWVVFCGDRERRKEAQKSARDFAGVAKVSFSCHGLKDTMLPFAGQRVKSIFESFKSFDPDLILTGYRHDLHQDHRFISELTWNTFRRHLILEYEIPKYDGDFGSPNVFIPLEDRIAKKKVQLLFKHFSSQRERHWFHEETFLGLMRLRAVESRMTNYAEAFYGRKLVL